MATDTGIDTLGRSCDVVRHGSLLKIALIRISFECVDFQKLSQIIANLLVKKAVMMPWMLRLSSSS